jgi:hypothetical protein
MDATVQQALVKWPNVPHCYGWLALDARGAWRMQSSQSLQQSDSPQSQTQSKKRPDEKIRHPALLDFINRNYTHDAQGRWYFQNGPQRVYIDLEAAPYIARIQPSGNFILHTGTQMASITRIWLSEQGRLYLQDQNHIALLDDRDLAQCLPHLRINDANACTDSHTISDERLLAWLEAPADNASLSLQWQEQMIPVNHILEHEVAAHFGFIRVPRKTD